MNESSGNDFPLGRLIGMSIERPSPGHAVSRAASSSDHLNPHGFVHGGVIFILVDTSMGAAVMSMLSEGKRCSTIECQVRYLRSVVDADLVCETVVTKPGRNIFHLESRVSTGDGVLVATGTGSFAVLDA